MKKPFNTFKLPLKLTKILADTIKLRIETIENVDIIENHKVIFGNVQMSKIFDF